MLNEYFLPKVSNAQLNDYLAYLESTKKQI